MFEFIGILFLLLGIIFLFIPSQRKRKVFIIPLVLGLTITYLHTLGPLAGKSRKIKDILAMDSTSIVEIHVYPYDDIDISDLVKSDRLINKQTILNKFSTALNKGVISNDYNKNPLWACYVDILKNDQSIIRIEIRKQGSETLLRPVSKGRSKWFYGTIRADEVGNLLEQVAGY